MSRNVFNTVQMRKPAANWFDLSHDFKFSTDMGVLTPVMVQEVIPGDVFRMSSETLIRFAPLIAPVMHSINVFTHYFFVPNRILWPNWEAFISPDLAKTVPPAWPHFDNDSGPYSVGSLADYMGLPTGVTVPAVSAMPFAAYQAIYDEYYRDQNLQSKVNYKLVNGSNNSNGELRTLRRRAWQHDYFTASLPFAQKGPAVELPLGSFQDVPVHLNLAGAPDSQYWWQGTPGGSPASGTTSFSAGLMEDSTSQAIFDPQDSLIAETSQLIGSAASINDLRVAMRLQEWFEKAARGGSRYVEQLMVHWNVRSSDARLNRPEFLGGVRNPVVISEVLQTSESNETPQANMAGHGISAAPGRTIRYRAEEHGYIIGIMSVMPKTAYFQGIPRHFSRPSWEDYAWPTFAHLGEQEVLNKEIYVASDSKNADTFGYVPRYSEYRYTPSRVSGAFRDSLMFWHLGRHFANRPALNSTFIESNPSNRIFAVQAGTQKLWCHTFHKCQVYRKLPKYGTPTL